MRKLLLLLLVSAVPASGATPWTLRQCIDYALENNLTIKQNVLSVRQSEIELNTAENSRLPGVSASASQNFSFGRGLTADNTYDNSNTTSTGFNLGADVPVFQGFQIRNNIALQKLNLAAATADLEKARDDIRVAVAQAYVQILYNMEILDVAESQIGIDSMQVDRLREMYRSGKASMAEVAQQEASLSQSRLQKTQASNNLRLSILDLTQLLELDSPEGFSVVRPSSDASPSLLPSPEDIYADAVGRKASVLAEEKRLDVASTRIDMARGQRLPTVSLSGGLGTNYYTSSRYASSSFGDQMKNNFSQFLGLSLSVPIFSRFSTRNNIKSAALSYDTQLLAVDNVKKALYKEIQQAYYNALGSQEKYASSASVVASSREAFNLVSAKYENGKATITEFNESKNNLMKAESDQLQARYELLYQRALLDFYRGRALDF